MSGVQASFRFKYKVTKMQMSKLIKFLVLKEHSVKYERSVVI